MLLMTETLGSVSIVIAALAVILTFGTLTASADEPGAWAAFSGPDVSLPSGVQRCVPVLGDSLSEGSECPTGWPVNHLLLDTATRFAIEQGQAVFGKHIRVVNSLSYSPEVSGLAPGLDVVLPSQFSSSLTFGAAPSESSASFPQQGVMRWINDHGSDRFDTYNRG